jgi:LacI family transcriptional regulator
VIDSRATAVLAVNDSVAVGLIEALHAAGVAVPGQISVVGVDDIPEARIVRLTTVAGPTDEAGRAAVAMLLGHEHASRARRDHRGEAPAQGSEVTRLTLPTRLIVRESTGPGPSSPVPGGAKVRA